MTRDSRSRWTPILLTWMACCVAGLVLAVATEDPWLTAAPLLVAATAVAIRRVSIRSVVLGLVFVALVVENPQERPAMGLWKSWLYPPGELLYENLNTLTGIGALRFSLLDLFLAVLVGLVLVRRIRRRRIEPGTVPSARPITVFLLVTFGALIALEVWGIAHGGNFKNSLWQVRQLLWFPLIALLLQATLRGPRDMLVVGSLIIVAAFFKTAVGVYFSTVVAARLHIVPVDATTHSDTVLFVSAVMVAINFRLLHPSTASRWVLRLTVPIVGLGIVVNNRRLAFVDIAVCLVLTYLIFPNSPLKRATTRIGAAAMPLFLVYAVIGWSSTSRIFAPIHSFATVLSTKDRSMGTRDIENYNLIQTLKQHWIFGWGFGHEYLEYSKADSIVQYFALYRYIGHNSILWLMAIGGFVGFSAVWMILIVGFYLSARSFRMAKTGLRQAAALSALGIMVAFMLQSYGDMGLQSWTGMLLLALALAMTSKLAVATGAYPATRFIQAVQPVRPRFGVAVPNALPNALPNNRPTT